MAAGFPVPPGFVLTTKAYDDFVGANDIQQQIVDLASTVSVHDPQSGQTAAEAIKRLFIAAEIPESICSKLTLAYAKLIAQGETAVAVRSSATVEDLPLTSFAGQHDTFLNIRGEEALMDAVMKCWLSLWSASAISYRKSQEIDLTAVSQAVVVQQFLPADAASILFTANPSDGERNHIVINATWGLGEVIVSGEVTPDTLIVDKSTRQIISRDIKRKLVMTVRAHDGTERQTVPQIRQNLQALDDTIAIELANNGARIEDHYGQPMDIEWAISADDIAILQARPFTNFPPAPLKDVRWDPPRPGTIWMRRQIVEHMPEPLSPLFDELFLRKGLDYSMESLTAFMGDLSGIEINIWDFLDPPFATTVNGYAYSIASFNFGWKLLPLALRMYIIVLPKMILHLLPRWRDESLPAYQAKIEKWKKVNVADAPDEDLLQGVRELAAEDAIYWFAAAVPLGLARVTDAALDRFLNSLTAGRRQPHNSRLISGAFLRGFPSKSTDAQIQLEVIATKINENEVLSQQVIKTPAPRLLSMLAKHDAEQLVLDDIQRYFDVYGHQIYDLDFATPTLADDPLPVLLSLQSAVAHPERDTRSHQARLAQDRDALTIETKRSLDPIRRWIFQLLLGWAQRYSPYREEALFHVGAAWPVLRRLALELGRRLTEAGSLYGPDDVFFLESAELEQACQARTAGAGRSELSKLARERRNLREARKRLVPPVSVPPGGRMKFRPIDMAMFEPKPRIASTGPTLNGFAVSPGIVTAPASVIRSSEDFQKMVADTILVCTATTPAWTPLFAQAKGLITDIGGALAHGSIVAREYGIPAVMGTGDATKRIESGQLIRIDGNTGTVTQVDQVEELADSQLREQSQKPSNRRKKALLILLIGYLIGFIFWKWHRLKSA